MNVVGINIFLQVSMEEKIYIQSVAMFKSATAGQVKRITFNNSDGRWWKEGWSSANSSVTRGVLFTPKIEVNIFQLFCYG